MIHHVEILPLQQIRVNDRISKHKNKKRRNRGVGGIDRATGKYRNCL